MNFCRKALPHFHPPDVRRIKFAMAKNLGYKIAIMVKWQLIRGHQDIRKSGCRISADKDIRKNDPEIRIT